MLTLVRRMGAMLASAIVALFLLMTPAHADPVCTAWGDTDPAADGLQYGCVAWSGGSDGGEDGGDGGGGGTPTTPQCTFFDLWNEFCQGNRACYMNDPAAIQDIEKAREDDPSLKDKPEDAEKLIFTSCKESADAEEVRTYYWDSEFQMVTILDRIQAARGALNLPTITAEFNPPTRTLVNLDTWWWAEGAPAGEVVGSPALGMRAIASPRGMTVSAGGQTIDCPLVTQKSDECSMMFRRAGNYQATMTITYDIRFEMGGQVIDVPAGAQDLLTISTTATAAVPVLEVQSIVTEVD
ncbi:hypothetical protein [Aeromicrobium choanae]|uniref:Uncharacterized protein n=1 Tax=Aeromicrobium choanae TaxID=1736691 RepID=A0A1T4YLZ8_9ACTN|nr:hypothetical protein [Aeromicrobium choanae]SKB02713.1 hypothetical protein SAMN06295964_0040 [Aeromicrobium choanae]